MAAAAAALAPRHGCGRSGSAVAWASGGEVAFACGNTLVLLDVASQHQRLLPGGGDGISCFACSARARIIAVAEAGLAPRVALHRQHDLQLLQRLDGGTEFGYSAAALSGDGELLALCSAAPDCQLSLWHWRKGQRLASVQLQQPAASISFHPGDASLLATQTATAVGSSSTASEPLQLWRLDRLWQRHELHTQRLQLPPGCCASSHAWAPEGLYVGCSNGVMLCIDPASCTVLASSAAAQPGASTPPAMMGPISSIAVNSLAVVAASTCCKHLAVYSRAASTEQHSKQQHQQLVLLGSVHVSMQGCECLCFGGRLHKQLVASTADGSLLLLTQPDGAASSPADMQIEPLADTHVGAVTGLAPAPDGAHLLSCGADGSVRVWAAAAGQLVGKRDLGGRLTCCAAGGPANAPVLALGSEAGVLRLLALSDLQRLPVVYRQRLHAQRITQLACDSSGSCLAVAAAPANGQRQGRIALLALAGYERVQLLGYVSTPDPILAMCWCSSGAASQPQLLISMQGGSLLVLTPPAASSSSNSNAAELSFAELHAVAASTEVPLLQLAAVHTAVAGSSGSSSTGMPGQQLLGLGSDGRLHRLLLPADAAGCAVLHGKALSSAAKLELPAVGVALAASPGGSQLLLSLADGSLAVQSCAVVAAAAGSTGGGLAAQWVAAHAGSAGSAASLLAWSADGAWAASAAADGSLLLHQLPGSKHVSEPGRPRPLDAALPDEEAPDDAAAATLAEAAAAAAAVQACSDAEHVRQATLLELQALRDELAQLVAANAAAPHAEQLSAEELVLDTARLQQLRAGVDAEVAGLLQVAARQTQTLQIRAQRLKALCWDSMQTKGAVCTGLKDAAAEVHNFPLPPQDEAEWAKIANLRRIEMLEAAAQGLDTDAGSPLIDSGNPSSNSPQEVAATDAAGASAAASSKPGTARSAPTSGRSGGGNDAHTGTAAHEPLPADGSCSGDGTTSATASGAAAGAGTATAASMDAAALLARLARGPAAACRAADLLYAELEVAPPSRKLVQAQLYQRMAWELKTQFNREFDALAKQKHCDADRLADMATRMDELTRELLSMQQLLQAPPPTAATQQEQDGMAGASSQSGDASTEVPAAAAPARAAADDGTASELAAGRLVVHWSPREDMQQLLFGIQPCEVKAQRYLSATDHARAAAEEAAAEDALRCAAADDMSQRALKQMMGGRLERGTDVVAELAASRPAWMNGNPADFSEEQLRQYKEYCAEEQAAIEERLKRKAAMEAELRTLKAAAQEVAAKFDAAVMALASRRLDVLGEVTALECRMLRLLADYEVATVVAGPAAEQAAVVQLQAAQEALASVGKELQDTQQLLEQQQEALAALHAEERASDRGLRREFAAAEPAALHRLVALYKARLVSACSSSSTAASSSDAGSAELQFAAVGSPAAAAGADLHGPLGPAEVAVSSMTEAQRPEGLPPGMWERFVAYRAAQGRLDIAMREQASKVLCLMRQQELLMQRQQELSADAAAAAEALDALRAQRTAAMHDLELQLQLTSGQVECVQAGVSGCTAEARLLARQQVAALHGVIRAKGTAKLELLQQMKDFKRGIYQLEWQNRCCEMQAEDVARLTQQLQLLHVTKDFQQLVKASSGAAAAATTSTAATASKMAAGRRTAAAADAASAAASGAGKEVANLESLLKARQALHAKAVERKRRQLRQLEGKVAVRQQENAAAAQQLAGTDAEAVERARLGSAAAAADTSADERMTSLMTLHKLKSIAAAQAAEIAAAQAELAKLQQRNYPCLPPLGAPAAIIGSAAGVAGALSAAKAGGGRVGPAGAAAAASGTKLRQ